MTRPKLVVIAGCNGSGKSSFSNSLTPLNVKPYDFDRVYKEIYDSLISTDISDKMAYNLAREHFESAINTALEKKMPFCYETNFNSEPLYWPTLFKEKGYTLELIYFCLESTEKAKIRVRIRYAAGGHFVPDKEVESRYKLGFEYLNKHWEFFDRVSLFETSFHDASPKQILTMQQNIIVANKIFPEYLKKLLPSISKVLY